MKNTILIFVLMLSYIFSFGQLKFTKDKFYSKLEGYIITNDGVKEEKLLTYEHPVHIQYKIRTLGEAYTPGEIKGFFIDNNYWMSTKIRKKEIFAPTSHYGAITVYHHLKPKEGQTLKDIGWDSEYNVNGYMKKLDEDPINTATLLMGFRKKMSAVVSDYPELSKKIVNKEKEYGMIFFDKIVDEYNEWYKQNNPETVTESKVSEQPAKTGKVFEIPKKVVGKWQLENIIISINESIITRDEQGDISRYYEGNISEYDVEKGFIAAKVYKVFSSGNDLSKSYTNEYYILYFQVKEDGTVEIATPSGSGTITEEYIHGYHDNSSQNYKVYQKVE